jgi:hypothetical protein
MSQISKFRVLTTMVLLAFAVVIPMRAQDSAAPPSAPDSTLYTTYTGTRTSLNWTVCGSTAQSEGCYSSGSIGPFVGVGAMLEGNPSAKGNVVTRAIYVVDSGSSNVTLYIYKKVDTVSATYDSVTVTLARTLSLPLLTGGSTAVCFMAANNTFLFIGTDQSTQAVEVHKGTLTVTQVGGFSPPINVTSITSDQYGYVTVTQAGGFTVVGPDGSGREDGGGTDFMLGTTQAVRADALLGATAQPERPLVVRPKANR